MTINNVRTLDESFDTLCARTGSASAPLDTPPIAPPIYQTAVFDVGDLDDVDAIYEGRKPGWIYHRDGNPTVRLLEEAVARLEGAEDALATASGMAAISAALLAALAPGDHVVAADLLYGRTLQLLRDGVGRFGVETTFVDPLDLGAVAAALRPATKLIFVETIANPLLRVPDLRALATLAHERGARLMVDHTFASPYLCRPLALGADLVVHSGTKYLGGHSDATSGLLAADRAFVATARRSASTWGAPLAALDAWLTLRGMKTLALRMERACANALAVARFLAAHPAVVATHYPGLEDHPDHAIAAGLFGDEFGAMVSFEVAGGRAGAERFIRAVRHIPFAPSLADVTTTLSHPATTSHRGLPPDERARLGVTDGLIRLSVGIEAADDIIADLERGLRG